MADDSSASPERPLGERLKRGVETKILVPAAVTIVSVAVSYLIKKLPLLIEEKLLPKLQEKEAPEQVTRVVEEAASALGGAPAEDGGAPEEDSAEKPDDARQENDAREAKRREREQHRRERRRGMKQAA